jgi:hypothetical protein
MSDPTHSEAPFTGDESSESPELIWFLVTLRFRAVNNCRSVGWHCLCFVSDDWLIFWHSIFIEHFCRRSNKQPITYFEFEIVKKEEV